MIIGKEINIPGIVFSLAVNAILMNSIVRLSHLSIDPPISEIISVAYIQKHVHCIQMWRESVFGHIFPFLFFICFYSFLPRKK